MLLQGPVPFQILRGGKVPCDFDFIIEIMNSVMAYPADIYSLLEVFPGETLPETGPAMHLLRYQVMKCALRLSPAEGTDAPDEVSAFFHYSTLGGIFCAD